MLARLIASLVFATACAFASVATAQDGRWYRAESANFIVYGDMSDQQVRNAAQSLEDFDLVLRALMRQAERPTETKLEVYLVRNIRGLRVVAPGMSDDVGGFYTAGNDMIAAFSRYDRDMGLDRRTILFHEYAHHFMLHYFPAAYPGWYVEGFAEYVSTVEIVRRRATIGRPSDNRFAWLDVPGYEDFEIEHLIAPERVTRPTNLFMQQYYAYSWFAASYLSNTTERLRGLERYVALLGEGGDPVESFEPAFGITVEQFGEELDEYRRGGGRSRLLHIDMPTEMAPITVTRLPRSANDLLLPLARLRTSSADISDEDAAEITQAAQAFINEPMARLVLARLAIRRGDNAGARGHLDALFSTQENHPEGRYLLAKMILDETEELSPDEARAGLVEARRHLVRSFREDPNYYPTLYLYALTFAGEYEPMSDDQLEVLARALELAPQADHIRMLLARELIRSEEYDLAVATLRPVIYAPHGGDSAMYARWLFDAARAQEQPQGHWRDRDTPAAVSDGAD